MDKFINIGSADRIVRVILGLALLAVLAFVDSPVRWTGLLGFVLLGTAATRVCPIYLPFGIRTSKLLGH